MAAMEIDVDGILRQAGTDGSMDFAAWPMLLPVVISRIEKIARQEFPVPNLPVPAPPRARPASPGVTGPVPSSDPVEVTEPTSSQETNKENTIPVTSSPPLVAQPKVASSSDPSSPQNASRERAQTPSRPSHVADGAFPRLNHLPEPLANMLEEITSTLGTFKRQPPHTLQRLAELVLRPRQHYRSLPAYLLALDRVVHVTSGAHVYPLPPAVPDMSALSVLANGGSRLSINSSTIAATIGSDEALGGALLTPIPWLARRANGSEDGSEVGGSSPLTGSPSSGTSQNAMSQQHQHMHHQQIRQRSPTATPTGPSGRALDAQLRTESTETIDGPNGVGSIETVSIQRGSVTQGELLRQEQRMGVIPVSQLARQGAAAQGIAGGSNGYAASGTATVSAATTHVPSAETKPEADVDNDGDVVMAENHAETEDNEEVPHARGPAEIGAVDLGPQSETTSTLTMGSDGTVDMQVDVQAATGQPPVVDEPKTALTTCPGSSRPSIPQSPKREAEDDMDAEASASKRVKADDSEQVPGDAPSPSTSATTEVETVAGHQADPKPSETDADGDLVLEDGGAATGEVLASEKTDQAVETDDGNADAKEDGGSSQKLKVETGEMGV